MTETTKATITKIETEYSENDALDGKTFDNMLDADIAVLKAVTGLDATDLCYDKTDYTITWSDGEIISGTLNANRATNFSSHLADRIRWNTQIENVLEGFKSNKEWKENREAWALFAENHAV